MRVGVKRTAVTSCPAVEVRSVQRLDVGEQVLNVYAVGFNTSAEKAVKHERIVGIGAVGQR